MTETTFTQKVPALPAWKVIWEMLLFRPWLWFIDLVSVALIRFCWQIAPALIIKAFFDMVTGEAQLTFGIWAIVAFTRRHMDRACHCQLWFLLCRCAHLRGYVHFAAQESLERISCVAQAHHHYPIHQAKPSAVSKQM